ncbi:uncharacterized protein BYT42DRAFT_186346 [Radiomyces spectabilis]|uniref:uncharacterized protein n=1 Tax=Radiomyces spectabilis TaxID=64574 RepID=UPI0022203CE3|nr:uncharacterized protein BYT42DRAFT_186346 [Radiomyces spectabilis]KAI8391225.1 hypothetical protein BYT42DRAFT_186346 [Radiomyces spectabilis]
MNFAHEDGSETPKSTSSSMTIESSPSGSILESYLPERSWSLDEPDNDDDNTHSEYDEEDEDMYNDRIDRGEIRDKTYFNKYIRFDDHVGSEEGNTGQRPAGSWRQKFSPSFDANEKDQRPSWGVSSMKPHGARRKRTDENEDDYTTVEPPLKKQASETQRVAPRKPLMDLKNQMNRRRS